MRGTLKRKGDNKVNSAGKSYDLSLYTFKEMDYKKDWVDLAIVVKKTELLKIPIISSSETEKENDAKTVKIESVDDMTDTLSSRMSQG